MRIELRGILVLVIIELGAVTSYAEPPANGKPATRGYVIGAATTVPPSMTGESSDLPLTLKVQSQSIVIRS